MTHRGGRSMWFRIYDPGTTAGEVELRLEWRKRGQARWSQNPIVPTPLVGGFALVDLGECQLSQGPLGADEWEWRVTARTTGTAGADIDLDRVWVLPTEQLTNGSSPDRDHHSRRRSRLATSSISRREALNGVAAPIGGSWATSGGTGDLSVETTGHTVQRSTTSDSSARAAILGSTDYTNLAAQIDILRDNNNQSASQLSRLILRWVDANNKLQLDFTPTNSGYQTRLQKVVANFTTDLAPPVLVPATVPGNWYTLRCLRRFVGEGVDLGRTAGKPAGDAYACRCRQRPGYWWCLGDREAGLFRFQRDHCGAEAQLRQLRCLGARSDPASSRWPLSRGPLGRHVLPARHR